MKAIRVHEFGGPEVLKLEEVPDLEPGKGQVVVEVRAVGVNPVEAYIRNGTYAMKPALPYTPGGDAAGVVTSTELAEESEPQRSNWLAPPGCSLQAAQAPIPE